MLHTSEAAYIGLMSGTSMDGIDAVLVDLESPLPKILKATTQPWSPTLRERLQSAARGSYLTADQFAQLDAEVGEAFAAAARQVIAGYDPADIRAIGSHGQTLAHAADAQPGYSLQIGCPARIAETTGITTVADFRRRDIAAGGQGAPLVPAFHQAILQSPDENRVVLNIGGIANVTCLPSDNSLPVSGFDTGPGNCLMDGWAQQQLGEAFDRDGSLAASGSVQPELLQELLADPYFQLVPPKSTGTDHFSAAWLREHLSGRNLQPADVQATLLELTAESIARIVRQQAPDTARVLLCGGGIHNRQLMQRLGDNLACPLQSTADYGIDPDWVEAVAFAWLAQQTLNGRAGNIATVTGAAGARILGAIYPA